MSPSARWWREAIESIVIAIVLALLFRAFEAEAFVIPTGSMAPTLMGRHKDVKCPECHYRYAVGASEEGTRRGYVQYTICPMCGYWLDLKLSPGDFSPRHVSFSGDRILVNKFCYLLGEPQRWDVIVFKYPGNAKQNYIKRLVGLPNETVRIWHGDIWVKGPEDSEFHIARKDPAKLLAMLQPVHDTRFTSDTLAAAGWPQRWQPAATHAGSPSAWQSSDAGRTFTCNARDQDDWLFYWHTIPSYQQWQAILAEEPVVAVPVLITDFYTYNDLHATRPPEDSVPIGDHWVGDLAMECDVTVESDGGEILLALVEAGRHHVGRIDVAAGTATLTVHGNPLVFDGDRDAVRTARIRQTGRGRYRLRFANVDNQLLLWVNDCVCHFNQPTTYTVSGDELPSYSHQDPGDLTPARIGGRNVRMKVSSLKVRRDLYYIATRARNDEQTDDFDTPIRSFNRRDELYALYSSPRLWNTPDSWFRNRRSAEYVLGADQFFPLGDNSPQSKDARLWPDEYLHFSHTTLGQYYVERELLIGKAIFVYWPHAWRVAIPGTMKTIPLLPNVGDMRTIR